MKSLLTRTLAGALLVFLALSAAFFSLCAPFQLPLEPYLPALCLLCASLAGLLYALPGSRRPWLTLGVLALTALLILWRWDDFLLGAQVVFHKITYAYSQELPLLYYELPLTLSQSRMSHYATLFLSLCAPAASLWLGTWFLGGRSVWPGVLTTCLLPGLSLFILRQPHPACLAALLLLLSLVLLSRRSWRMSPALGARRTLAALLPLALTMGLLALLFPAGSYQRSPWVEDLRRSIQSFNTSQIVLSSSPAGLSQDGVQRFDRFGPPKYDGHTVLTVLSDVQEPSLLLRGFSAGVYTRRGWEQLPQKAPETASQSWLYPSKAAYGASAPLLSQTTVTHVDDSPGYYYVPYFPLDLSSLPADPVGDGFLPREAGAETYSLTHVPSSAVPPGAYTADGDEELYRQYVYENYLAVPYDLMTTDTRELFSSFAQGMAEEKASFTDQRSHRLYQAQRVREYLSSFTRYDLEAPSPPFGADFVSYFLTISRRGYCVHYATAATLLLRELGVPARFAAGYVAELTEPGVTVDVPDRNSHAWVEVYVDGFGWQPVDVTPGFSGNPSDSEVPPSPSPSPTPTAAPSSGPTPSPSQGPQAPEAPTPGGARPGLPLLLLAVLALPAALLALLFLQRYLRLRRRRAACRQKGPNAAALALYRYLAAVERRAGLPIPPQALALAQKAAFSQHTLTPSERHALETAARQAHRALRSAPLGRRLLYRFVWALC